MIQQFHFWARELQARRRYLHTHVHRSIIHNSQDVGAAKSVDG